MMRLFLFLFLFLLVDAKRSKSGKKKSGDRVERFALARLMGSASLFLDQRDTNQLLNRLEDEFEDAVDPCDTRIDAFVYEQIIVFDDARVTVLFVIDTRDDEACNLFPPNLVDDINQELMVSLESLQEVVAVPCVSDVTEFESQVIVELEANTTDLGADAVVLQDGFQSVYNTLQDSLCDPLFRRLQDVRIETGQRRRRLQPQIMFFFVAYFTRGTCRGCAQETTILDDGFRRRRLSSSDENDAIEQCYCPIQAVETMQTLRPPRPQEVLASYDGFVEEEIAQGNLNNVAGVGDTIIQVDDTLPSATPSATPSAVPSVAPSVVPSVAPSAVPSVAPSAVPSVAPSAVPSVVPSAVPSAAPSVAASVVPSAVPSVAPSAVPSTAPSAAPSAVPSAVPSPEPSPTPSTSPSAAPTVTPTTTPSSTPSVTPSKTPSVTPSTMPSTTPSKKPSATPSATPSKMPSKTPSWVPSKTPSDAPSVTPTRAPSFVPSSVPSMNPSMTPSLSMVPTESPQPSPAPTTVVPPPPTESPRPSPTPSNAPSPSPKTGAPTA